MADERLIPAGIRDVSTLAMNKLIDRLGLLPLDQLLVNLVDNVTAGALPWLAEQFHVTGLEGWNLCVTEADRRSLIKRAIWLHRKKGTPWAVKEGLKSVGFGGAELIERLPSLNYDGAETFTGTENYGSGVNWARFKVLLDLGENRGVSLQETALIRDVVTEWKNERSHLDAITFRAVTTDTATISDTATIATHDTQPDILPWGLRYDGSVFHNSGRLLTFDGADTYSGSVTYRLAVDGGTTYNNEWDSSTATIHTDQADQHQVSIAYNGLASYDGVFDQGATPPPLYDTRMTVTARRHNLFSGLRTYGSSKQYDGSWLADGSTDYQQMRYEGIHTIQEITI
jgi:P2-related tail formation protein